MYEARLPAELVSDSLSCCGKLADGRNDDDASGNSPSLRQLRGISPTEPSLAWYCFARKPSAEVFPRGTTKAASAYSA